jgi:hypothetical protein
MTLPSFLNGRATHANQVRAWTSWQPPGAWREFPEPYNRTSD